MNYLLRVLLLTISMFVTVLAPTISYAADEQSDEQTSDTACEGDDCPVEEEPECD